VGTKLVNAGPLFAQIRIGAKAVPLDFKNLPLTHASHLTWLTFFADFLAVPNHQIRYHHENLHDPTAGDL
jgi:hypothetical protein